MTNTGKWDPWYTGLNPNQPQPYGDTTTYQIGAQHLHGCQTIEDWGCGKGGFQPHTPPGSTYHGIDGSRTPFATRHADLTTYQSTTPGLFMRHVLEHNHHWQQILDNAIASFTDRMALIIFTPPADETHVIAHNPDIDVPDIAFAHTDITSRFTPNITWTEQTIPTATQYGHETIYLLTKTPTP